MRKLCVFGGHYGSEGKGAAAEFWIRHLRLTGTGKIAAFGENSPNSGHTCSRGKTRNMPASAFFADVVILGPDSVVDIKTLEEDLLAVRAVNPNMEIYIHEHAAWMTGEQKAEEVASSLKTRIGSTQSGSGQARCDKYMHRDEVYTIKANPSTRALLALGVRMVNRFQWMHFVKNMLAGYDWIFECSQGALLDTNWGHYPFVTSRTTLPQAAIERNGLGSFAWEYVGVYRTFPIRTGGNSGPTGERETDFGHIGVPQEIATVTKRIRRVFCFSHADFELSVFLTRPSIIMVTHGDYLKLTEPRQVYLWMLDQSVMPESFVGRSLYVSFSPGDFHKCHDLTVPVGDDGEIVKEEAA